MEKSKILEDQFGKRKPKLQPHDKKKPNKQQLLRLATSPSEDDDEEYDPRDLSEPTGRID